MRDEFIFRSSVANVLKTRSLQYYSKNGKIISANLEALSVFIRKNTIKKQDLLGIPFDRSKYKPYGPLHGLDSVFEKEIPNEFLKWYTTNNFLTTDFCFPNTTSHTNCILVHEQFLGNGNYNNISKGDTLYTRGRIWTHTDFEWEIERSKFSRVFFIITPPGTSYQHVKINELDTVNKGIRTRSHNVEIILPPSEFKIVDEYGKFFLVNLVRHFNKQEDSLETRLEKDFNVDKIDVERVFDLLNESNPMQEEKLKNLLIMYIEKHALGDAFTMRFFQENIQKVFDLDIVKHIPSSSLRFILDSRDRKEMRILQLIEKDVRVPFELLIQADSIFGELKQHEEYLKKHYKINDEDVNHELWKLRFPTEDELANLNETQKNMLQLQAENMDEYHKWFIKNNLLQYVTHDRLKLKIIEGNPRILKKMKDENLIDSKFITNNIRISDLQTASDDYKKMVAENEELLKQVITDKRNEKYFSLFATEGFCLLQRMKNKSSLNLAAYRHFIKSLGEVQRNKILSDLDDTNRRHLQSLLVL